MTKAEKNKWIKKFKSIAIQKQEARGEAVDTAFTKLYDLMEDFENETGIFLRSRISKDKIPDVFFGSGEGDEVTDAIHAALDTASTWRDIAAMLDSANTKRDVFVLLDGQFFSADPEEFVAVKDAVIKALEELDEE